MTRSIFAEADARANRLAAALERVLARVEEYDAKDNTVYRKVAREIRGDIKGPGGDG